MINVSSIKTLNRCCNHSFEGSGALKHLLILSLCFLLLAGCTGLQDQKRREQYVDSHPELSGEVERLIVQGKIQIGMSKDEVLASWGKPRQIHQTVGPWGLHEQWVYGSKNSGYLNFENGVLTEY